MSDDRLIEALTTARDVAVLPERPPGHATPSLPSDTYASIIPAVTDHIELKKFYNRWLDAPTHGGYLRPIQLASALAARVFSGTAASTAITDLIEFLSLPKCDAHFYVSVYGRGVTEPVHLSDAVSVIPASLCPPSIEREILFGLNADGHLIRQHLPSVHSDTLLQIGIHIEHVLSKPPSHPSRLGGEVERALRALTIAGDSAFVRGWTTSRLIHRAVPYDNFGGWGAGGDAPGHRMPRPELTGPISIERAQQFYKLLGDTAQIEAPIELAIDRLTEARCHRNPADIVLDLGIAAEMMLIREKGTELKYRLALRGAYLTGHSAQERHEKFESFRELYDARSMAAHSGALKKISLDKLKEFDALCGATIVGALMKGLPDNWERLILEGEQKSETVADATNEALTPKK